MPFEIYRWANESFYDKNMYSLENHNLPDTTFWPYTVIGYNAIEDHEISFLGELLKFCRTIENFSKLSRGVICGNPESKLQIEEMIGLVSIILSSTYKQLNWKFISIYF